MHSRGRTDLTHPRPRIIVLSGQSGSGKSHLCRELTRRGIACIDTDDVVRLASTKGFEEQLRARMDSHDLVVLAGMYQIPQSLAPNVIERVALRPSPRKVGAAYRQYLLRNLDNVTRYARDIRAAVASTRSPKDIQNVIGHAIMINVDLVMSFEVFREHVEAAATHYRKLGYRVVSQEAALKAIVKIASKS